MFSLLASHACHDTKRQSKRAKSNIDAKMSLYGFEVPWLNIHKFTSRMVKISDTLNRLMDCLQITVTILWFCATSFDEFVHSEQSTTEICMHLKHTSAVAEPA